jgi:hypothetical protein
MANMSFGGGNVSSYFDLCRKGQVYMAQAIITAPVGYGTAAGTGGPFLWNGSGGTTAAPAAQVDAVILGLSFGVTVAETTTNIAIGLTGGANQTVVPTGLTAIDGITKTRIAGSVIAATGAGNQCSVYRVATPAAAGTWFFPIATLSTTAVTSMPHEPNYVDLAGMFIVPPGSWISVAGSVTGTAAVIQIGLVWAEVPRL